MPRLYGPGRETNECDCLHYWSHHSGGAHWLFGDGTVRSLNYSAAPVLPKFATRIGNEVVSAF